jgi:short-subunit dehydrogenase
MSADTPNVTAVLITGASRGIGRALTLELRARGVDVVAAGRDPDKLAELAAETGAQTVSVDLGEKGAPARLYRLACDCLGRAPDGLINNAGYNSRKARFIETTEEEFEAQYRVNLAAPAELCRLALRDMTKAKRGHIVNILSTAVLHASETMSLYSAMKHGLSGLTQVLVKEARPEGVKVSAVYPGGTDTEFRATPRPDYMRPESVAQMILNATFFAPSDAVTHELVFRPLVETNF